MDKFSAEKSRPSFRKMLARISVISAVTTMIVAWLFISATSMLSFRQYADKNLQLLAYTVSHSLEAAVVFGDGNAAMETLVELGKQGQFSSAIVADSKGKVLAHWGQDNEHSLRADPLARLVSGWLFPKPVQQPILHNGAEIGTITLTGEDATVTDFVYRSLSVLTLCLLLASVVAFLLTRHLFSGLIAALRNMTGVVHDIRATRNFSQRVPPSKIDELHVFGEDFNSLLNEIEKWQRREKKERDSLLKRALHDPLTGLANRSAFRSALDSVLSDSERKTHTALLFMDGDNFKDINDTWGHAAGDEVLMAIAGRLLECAANTYLVCRFGGDEFAMILDEVNHHEDIEKVIDTINMRMDEPIVLNSGESVVMTLSIGYAVASQAATAEDIMDAADRSMYLEKQQHHQRAAG
ncbi:MAG TPA: diguanylate cyclase [Erwinia persicina]|uniref:Diguanylate cyclase n=1 Tax=Erwinia persicina TaxID=55211 RepID=A0A3S7RZM6_9GAMM|nr:diguanylate cyclase DgcN [Erwinia persicina]AXU93926.1 diguanylate cyclase [Erwinia persicina]MBC3947950.1 diguanylate cyclase DgcN [Erwinia persicina]MBD8168022.1 diguanylate cyclase DgcN [Erwinia persicina]MCQ4095411.1 diguanylate cyclase DgcN [Erwinia persicina]MCQ4099831.1 diguanylate cyclase DgcN [Erwinia persicina]